MLDGLVAASEHEGRAALIGRLEDLAELARFYWVAPTAMSVRSLSPPAPPADALGGGGPGRPAWLTRRGSAAPVVCRPVVCRMVVCRTGRTILTTRGVCHTSSTTCLRSCANGVTGIPRSGITPMHDERSEIEYIDWQMISTDPLSARAALRLLKERADALPPTRPSPVTWSDGITGITQTGACAGGTASRSTGRDLATVSQPGVVVLVPTQHGCRPATVKHCGQTGALRCRSPRTFESGQVGFGDAAYIAAYDVWATHQNDLAQAIRLAVVRTPGVPDRAAVRRVPSSDAGQPLARGRSGDCVVYRQLGVLGGDRAWRPDHAALDGDKRRARPDRPHLRQRPHLRRLELTYQPGRSVIWPDTAG